MSGLNLGRDTDLAITSGEIKNHQLCRWFYSNKNSRTPHPFGGSFDCFAFDKRIRSLIYRTKS